MTRNEIREWLDKFAAKEGKEEGFEDWFDAITGSISPTEDTAYAIEKFMEEHANNKAEEMAIGFLHWYIDNMYTKTRYGSWARLGVMDEHLTDQELLERYKQTPKVKINYE